MRSSLRFGIAFHTIASVSLGVNPEFLNFMLGTACGSLLSVAGSLLLLVLAACLLWNEVFASSSSSALLVASIERLNKDSVLGGSSSMPPFEGDSSFQLQPLAHKRDGSNR